MSNMSHEYQEEVDDLSHEDIKGDSVIVDVHSNDHAFKDMKTLGQSVICKNEIIILVCTYNNDISHLNYK